jgi:hypothetical protein
MIEISKVERPFLLKFARDNGYKGNMEQLTKNPILLEDFKANFQFGGVVASNNSQVVGVEKMQVGGRVKLSLTPNKKVKLSL